MRVFPASPARQLVLFSTLLLFIPLRAALAQVPTGRVVGKVVSADQGSPIPGAVVEVVGTEIRAQTALDGRYALAGVPAGPVAIRARYIGYQPKVVTGVLVPDGGTVEQPVALAPRAVELEEITVTAQAERGTVNRALEEQRDALNVVSAITAEQIARSPDSDAGQAVQRVSGVTVQDGRYVFVRGLGERYTTTSLNGARIPSPEPERKLVPLDLFPSNLLEGITTAKTFLPDQPGDFSGASVNLQTREFPAHRAFSLSTSLGFNSAITGRTIAKAPGAGGEWLALNSDRRELPRAVLPYYRRLSLAGASQSDLDRAIASFRNTWSSRTGKGGGNGSLSLSFGGENAVGGQPVGYLGSVSYNLTQEIRRGERRAVINPGPRPGTYDPQNEYRGETSRASVLWGGLFNLSTRIGGGSKLSLSNTYTRAADNEVTRLGGYNDGFAVTLDQTRLTYLLRTARSHRLAGQHLLGSGLGFDWSAAVSTVSRVEPDRSDLAYVARVDSQTEAVIPTEWFGAPRSALRSFSDLEEDAVEGGANLSLALGAPSRPSTLKAGFLVRHTERVAASVPFDILNLSLTQAERSAPPEAIFDGAYAQAGRLTLQLNALGGRYRAEDRLLAAYAMAEWPLSRRVRVVGGARIEDSRIEVRSSRVGQRDTATVLANRDVLPALAVNTSLGENQNLRFSAAQTVSRPEYREISPVDYIAEPIGGKRVSGNPALRRALIQNLDLRWEWYPRAGEVVSAAAFYKHFQRPIERVLRQTADGNAPDVTFQNARAADNYGLELEVRARLDRIGAAPLSVFANATLMHSRIQVDTGDGTSLTNRRRAMVGQAGHVVNAGLEYTSGGLSATVLYNVVGRRIVEAGILPLPDAHEEARHLLDLSVRVPVLATLTFKLDARNLLDQPYRVTQGGLDEVRYRTGRQFAGGFTWTP